jgi:hypothetical protein
MSYTDAQFKIIVVAPMVTGSISFIASLTIIIMIFRSTVKLSTIYRRIILGTSVFDLLQSLSQVLSTIAMEKGAVWSAIGNHASCQFKGFLVIVGSCGAVLYSLSLTLYFLLVIKYEMSEALVKQRFEPYFHAVPILFSLAIGIITYATHNINPSGPTCWIDSRPPNCRDDPDVDCESFGNPNLFKLASFGVPAILVFIINCFILGVIWRKVRYQALSSQRLRQQQSLVTPRTPQGQAQAQTPDKSFFNCSPCRPQSSSLKQQQDVLSPLAARLARPSKAMIQRIKEVSNRAAAYIIGFLFTYLFSFIYRFWQPFGHVPFFIIFLSKSLTPLQGFFNVLIYIYPHVVSCRRNHGDYSFLKACWEVVKSGGDSDQVLRRGRRDSLRKQKKVLEANERRNSLGIMTNFSHTTQLNSTGRRHSIDVTM